jgi:hypothetical protein
MRALFLSTVTNWFMELKVLAVLSILVLEVFLAPLSIQPEPFNAQRTLSIKRNTETAIALLCQIFATAVLVAGSR